MLIDSLDRLAVDDPDRPAIVWEGGSISFSELHQAIGHTADGLLRDGLGRGDMAGLAIADEVDNFVTTLALLRAGCAHVVLPSHGSEAYRAELARSARCTAVVSDGTTRAGGELPHVSPRFGRSPATFATRPEPDDTAICFTSSGSTGRPKIVPLSHRQLAAQATRWQWNMRREVLFRPASIEFANARKHRLFAVCQGSTNVFPRAGDVLDACWRYGVTRLGLTLPQARNLLEQARREGRRLPDSCHVRFGSSAFPMDLRNAFLAHVAANVEVTYAVSEAGTIATATPSLWAKFPDSVGFVHNGLRVSIVDDDGAPVSEGERGLIRIEGEGLADRYLGDDEASAKAFRDGAFFPGDTGRLLPGGVLVVDGRADDMMSFAGINVFPLEIERIVSEHPDVLACAAFSTPNPSVGDIPLVAVVVRRSGTEADIQQFARERLGVRAPRQVFAVDALPLSSAGKIDRRALRRRFAPAEVQPS